MPLACVKLARWQSQFQLPWGGRWRKTLESSAVRLVGGKMRSLEKQKPIFGETEQPKSYRNYVEIPISYIFLEKKKNVSKTPHSSLLTPSEGIWNSIHREALIYSPNRQNPSPNSFPRSVGGEAGGDAPETLPEGANCHNMTTPSVALTPFPTVA